MRKDMRIPTVLGRLALAGVVVAISVPALAGKASGGPWSHVLYDHRGQLMAASGHEGSSVPLALTLETERLDDRVIATTTYLRGKAFLRIERAYEAESGLEVVYQAGDERLVIFVVYDDLTRETLTSYRFPDGQVFSLWVSEGGEVMRGDLAGLRKALGVRTDVGKLLEQYLRDTEMLRDGLPRGGDTLARLLPRRDCLDVCAEGCERQCAFECNLLGPVGCQICRTSCALGCLIGC